jgi:hypothetical protein
LVLIEILMTNPLSSIRKSKLSFDIQVFLILASIDFFCSNKSKISRASRCIGKVTGSNPVFSTALRGSQQCGPFFI